MTSIISLRRHALHLISSSKGAIKRGIAPTTLDINEMSKVANELFSQNQFMAAGKVDRALFNWIESTPNA